MRSDALRRRETILRTARELFAEHGASVAMEAIAEASGVGIGTLYRNFSARPELVEAVTIDMLQDVAHAARTAQAGLEASHPEAWTDFLSTLVQLNLGALAEALGVLLPHHVSERVMIPQRETGILVQQAIELAKDRGLVRRDMTGTELITGVGIATRPLPRVFAKAAPHMRERLIEIMLDGMKPQPQNAMPASCSAHV